MAYYEASSKASYWKDVGDDFHGDCVWDFDLWTMDCPPPAFAIPAPPPPPGTFTDSDQPFWEASISSSSLDDPTRLDHVPREDAVTKQGVEISNNKNRLKWVEHSCDALLIGPFKEHPDKAENLNRIRVALGSVMVVFLSLVMAGIFYRWKKKKRIKAVGGIPGTAVQEASSTSFRHTSPLSNTAGSYPAKDKSKGKPLQKSPTPGRSRTKKSVLSHTVSSVDIAGHRVTAQGADITNLCHQNSPTSDSWRGFMKGNPSSSAAHSTHPVEINGQPFFLVPANEGAAKTLCFRPMGQSHMEWPPPNLEDSECLGHLYEDIDGNSTSGLLRMAGVTCQRDLGLKRGVVYQDCIPNTSKSSDHTPSSDNPFEMGKRPMGGPCRDILPAESDFIVMVNRQSSLKRPVAYEGFCRKLADSDSGISIMCTPSPQRPPTGSFQSLATMKKPHAGVIGAEEEHLDCQTSTWQPATLHTSGELLHPAFIRPWSTAVSSEYSIPVDSPSSPVSLASCNPCLEVPISAGGGEEVNTSLWPLPLSVHPNTEVSFHQDRCHSYAAHLVYLEPLRQKSLTRVSNTRRNPGKTANM